MAGGFTTFGVALKIGYSAVAARRATNAAGLERFGDQRRQIYERFYDLVQKQLKRDRALSAFVEAHHKEGEAEISDEEKETVPPTFPAPPLDAELGQTTGDSIRLSQSQGDKALALTHPGTSAGHHPAELVAATGQTQTSIDTCLAARKKSAAASNHQQTEHISTTCAERGSEPPYERGHQSRLLVSMSSTSAFHLMLSPAVFWSAW